MNVIGKQTQNAILRPQKESERSKPVWVVLVLVPPSSLPSLSLLLLLGNEAHPLLLVLLVLEKPPLLALPEHPGPDDLPPQPVQQPLLRLVLLDRHLGVEPRRAEEEHV